MSPFKEMLCFLAYSLPALRFILKGNRDVLHLNHPLIPELALEHIIHVHILCVMRNRWPFLRPFSPSSSTSWMNCRTHSGSVPSHNMSRYRPYAKSRLRFLPVSSRATPSFSRTFIPAVAAGKERPLQRHVSLSEITGRSRSAACTRSAEPAARPLCWMRFASVLNSSVSGGTHQAACRFLDRGKEAWSEPHGSAGSKGGNLRAIAQVHNPTPPRS